MSDKFHKFLANDYTLAISVTVLVLSLLLLWLRR